MRLVIEINDETYNLIKNWNRPPKDTVHEMLFDLLRNGTPLSENNSFLQYEGKTYIADKLTMKTKDKDGYYSFYGFKEMEK